MPAGLAGDRDDRGDVDDAARAALAHRRHHRLAAVPHALDVDLKDAVPDGRVDRLEGRELDLAEVRSVVDQAVDAAEALQRLRRHVARRCVVADVALDIQRLAAGGGDRADRLVGGAEVGDDDVRALRGGAESEGLADAGGGAGDDDGVLVEQVLGGHGLSLGQ